MSPDGTRHNYLRNNYTDTGGRKGGSCILLEESIPLFPVDICRCLGIDDFFDVKDRSRPASGKTEGEDITGLFGISSSSQRHDERGYLGPAELTNEQERTQYTTHMSHHFPRRLNDF